jgi:hypothetical protein
MGEDTLEPPPLIPPAKSVPEDLVEPQVRDRQDVICCCNISETGLNCTRVAIYDIVFEQGCIHTRPYPVCIAHRDLYEWAMRTQVTEETEVGCFQCKPPLQLGRLVEFKPLRKVMS